MLPILTTGFCREKKRARMNFLPQPVKTYLRIAIPDIFRLTRKYSEGKITPLFSRK